MEVLWWVLMLLAGAAQASPDVLVAIDTVRWMRLTNDKFLSLSVSPSLLLTANNYSSVTVSMLQGLSPTYLRVGGTETDKLFFRTAANTSGAIVFTESQWMDLNQLAADTGVSLIVSLNPNHRGHDSWDPTNTQQLLQFSDQQGYNPIWQLGYEMLNIDRITPLNGSEVGRDVMRLREILDALPQYQKTAVLGPDFVARDGCDCTRSLKDFLLETSDFISIITLQLDTQKGLEDEAMFERLTGLTDSVHRMIGSIKSQAGSNTSLFNQRLWLILQKYRKVEGKRIVMSFVMFTAESTAESNIGGFSEAVVWTLKLGHAAQLGYDVVLRHQAQLSQPTPDYWVSLLYRNLVGRAVLDTQFVSANTFVTVFAHCTAYYELPMRPVLSPELEYKRGSVTVWGVNTAQDSTRLTVLVSTRQEYFHLYTLTADSQSGSTLLNGQVLNLTHGTLPTLSPSIQPTRLSMSVSVPARSVFYIVLPDIKARACLLNSVKSASEGLTDLPQANRPTTIKISVDSESNGLTLPKKLVGEKANFILEKGGIFENIETTNKSFDIFKNRDRNSKFNVKEWIQAVINNTKRSMKLKMKNQESLKNQGNNDNWSNSRSEKSGILLSVNDWLSKPFLANSSDTTSKQKLSDLLSKVKETLNERRDKFPLSKLIFGVRNATGKDMHENDSLPGEKTKQVGARFKRSEDEKQLYKPQIVELSPFHRRLSLLRRNRAFEILNNIPKSKLSVMGNQERPLQASLINGTDATKDQEQSSNFKLNGKYVSSEPLLAGHNSKANRIITSKSIKLQESDNLHYLPGEFYETLGGLKLDSNVSLRDIEDPHEAIPSITKESSKCKETYSGLKVYKKPDNEHHMDSEVIGNAKEQMKQYYIGELDLKKQLDVSDANDKSKSSEMKCCFSKHDLDESQLSHTKFKDESNANNNSQMSNNHRISSFQVSQPVNDDISLFRHAEISLNRTKRTTTNLTKDAIHISQTNSSEIQDGETSTKPDYSEESQLKMFLEELTTEEKLLKSFDEDHKQNTSEIKTTMSLPDVDNNRRSSHEEKKNIPADVSMLTSNLYVRNNLLNDNVIKPKRKYPTNSLLNSTTRSQNNTVINIISEVEDNLEKEAIPNITTKSIIISQISQGMSKSEPMKPTVVTHKNNYFEELSDADTTEENDGSDYLDSLISLIDTTIEPSKKYSIDDILDSTLSPISNTGIDVLKALEQDGLKEKNNPNITAKSSTDLTIPQETTNILPVTVFDKTYQLEEANNADLMSESILISKITREISTNSPLRIRKIELINKPSVKVVKSSDTKAPQLKPSTRLNDSLLSTPPVLTSSRSISQPSYINSEIANLNSEMKDVDGKTRITGNLGERTSTLGLMLSSKYKERLEAFKARLDKTRERLLNLTSSKVTPSLIPVKEVVKREVPLSQGVFNDIHNKGSLKSGSELLKQHEKFSFHSLKNNGLEKYLEDKMLKSSLTDEFDLIHRLARQMSMKNGQENLDQYSSLKSVIEPTEQVSEELAQENERSPTSDVLIPSYLAPINKWIIPLSNYTENIVLNNKVFPVKLYGILSDSWINKISTEPNSVMQDTQRKPRSIQNPCVRDSVNDYETEQDKQPLQMEKNGLKDSKVGQYVQRSVEKGYQSNQQMENKSVERKEVTPIMIFSPSSQHSNRSKRSINDDIERNEVEMKALLTNEIVKEGPWNDISDNERRESAFSTMLRKTLSRAVTNKTGIDNMFELAKQYQKTNPSSLEIFNSNDKSKDKKSANLDYDNSEDDNKAMEVTDNEGREGAKLSRNNSQKATPFHKSGCQTTNSSSSLKQDDLRHVSKKDMLSTFIKKIQEFFKAITSIIKKSLI